MSAIAEKYGIDLTREHNLVFSDYFYYDESSPTFLRWKIEVRSGQHRNILEKSVGDVAGRYPKKQEYSAVQLNSKLHKVHRVIWELFHGSIPHEMVIDHLDGDVTNNDIKNLRMITKAKNCRNGVKRSNNLSGVTGVCLNGSRWMARWYDLSGKLRSKSFSIAKYGDGAFILASDYRSKMILLLNQEGAGYTERHGNE